ncbi:unnamed protein product [Rhodiola kirilowii]
MKASIIKLLLCQVKPALFSLLSLVFILLAGFLLTAERDCDVVVAGLVLFFRSFGTIESLRHPHLAPLINQYSAHRIKRISTSSQPHRPSHRPWLKIQASTQVH